MAGQSEPVIEQMRQDLKDFLSKDVSFPSGTDAEKFFKTFRSSGRSTSSAKTGSIDSPVRKNNWSVFTPSVTGVAAGATGFVSSVTLLDIVFSGFSQTTDGINLDAAICNQGVRGTFRTTVAGAEGLNVCVEEVVASKRPVVAVEQGRVEGSNTEQVVEELVI